MTEPFIGEIRMFGGTFAPVGWMLCNGQTLNIAENEPLFTLIGTTYGGDGSQTFGLPDLRGRIPLGQGIGPGLTPRVIGEAFGAETVTLTTQQIPQHSHPVAATTEVGTLAAPTSAAVPATVASGAIFYSIPGSMPVTMSAMLAGSIGSAGGNQAHDNLMPYVCVSFIISLFGIFPSRP